MTNISAVYRSTHEVFAVHTFMYLSALLQHLLLQIQLCCFRLILWSQSYFLKTYSDKNIIHYLLWMSSVHLKILSSSAQERAKVCGKCLSCEETGHWKDKCLQGAGGTKKTWTSSAATKVQSKTFPACQKQHLFQVKGDCMEPSSVPVTSLSPSQCQNKLQ